ncbi:MAG: hypothetical protein U9Q07_08930 [Planctomycetota bacterium]|nr:hypothetical protein [Planctomycetota bacterium]
MKKCSVSRELQIVSGCLDDYKQLAHYHYRDNRPGPVAAIYALKSDPKSAGQLSMPTVGVVVYSMPLPELELRNIATGNFFSGLDKSTQLSLINRHIRCITRLIIDPRYRGLGLANRLIRETMPRLDVPIIEAMAVMGLVNPFLERAGMKAYRAETPVRSVRLIEAFSTVGIEDKQLIDLQKVQRELDRLGASKARFIELEIRRFLQSYSRCRDMPPGLKRTKYVLSKLTSRPVYYIWFNRRKCKAQDL